MRQLDLLVSRELSGTSVEVRGMVVAGVLAVSSVQKASGKFVGKKAISKARLIATDFCDAKTGTVKTAALPRSFSAYPHPSLYFQRCPRERLRARGVFRIT